MYAGLPELHAVLWQQGKITDLGTLPEGGYQSEANAVNTSGQVVGAALNTIPDTNSMQAGTFWLWGGAGGITPPYQYQTRAFLWDREGGMQDLGTLPGGTDAQAILINEPGQVVGYSYTGSSPTTGCPTGFLATGSFIWDKKNGMKDIGNLGGTCTIATNLNNRGQVIGLSNPTGDQSQHAFLWDRQHNIQDLGGSLGGNYTGAFALNDEGQAAGYAYFAGDTLFHAALWKHVGNMTDLGSLGSDSCSYATGINADGQVVGGSLPDCNGDKSRAFLWEDGSIFDLNALIPPGSPLYLRNLSTINDHGEIAGEGVDNSGNGHAFLLIPCDENHPDVEGCDYSMVDAATLQPSVTPAPQPPAARTPPSRMPAGLLNRLRSRWGQRTPVSGTVPEPAAKQSLPVNTDSVDLEDEYLLAPLAGHHAGYCGVSGSKLNGYCVAYSYYSCLAKASTACPSGQVPRKPGYFQCDNNYRRYVDLGRGCGF